MKRLIFAVIVVIAALLTVTGCDLIPAAEEPEGDVISTPITEAGVIVEANLVPAKYSALRFAMPGQVAEIAVSEGEEVEEGQLLAFIRPRIRFGFAKILQSRRIILIIIHTFKTYKFNGA